jgi:hypothetical protein
MVASRGPMPKRSEERRRTNDNSDGLSEAATIAPSGPVSGVAAMLEPDEGWHPIATEWYLSLGESGQAVFYQASDWATAYFLADQISRSLAPRRIFDFTTEEMTEVPADAVNGSALAAILKGMGSLGATEGDRRRMRLELSAPQPDPSKLPAGVVAITQAKSALGVAQ